MPRSAASAGPKASAAPSSRARSSFAGTASTPMTSWPSATATSSAAIPTPPRPTTITRAPGSGRPALMTAPPPVSTAQPSRAAISAGTSAATGTTDVRLTTAWEAKALTPRWWCTSCPTPAASVRCRRIPPPTRVPALLAAVPTSHGSRPSVRQPAQLPQRGRKVMTTRSPGATSVTPSPTCSTMPAASCPRSIGVGRTRLPSTTLRSEWQTPGGLDAHEQFTGRGRIQLERADRERPRCGERGGRVRPLQDGTDDLHVKLLALSRARR